MKNNKLKGLPKFHTGLRLLAAATLAIFGKFTAMALLLVLPIVGVYSFALGITPEEEAERKKLLDDVTTTVKNTWTAEQKEFLTTVKNEINTIVAQAKGGLIDKEVFVAKMKEVSEQLKAFDAEKFKAFETKIEELTNTMKEQGLAMKKFQENGSGMGTRKTLSTILKEWIGDTEPSDKFKEFVESEGKRKVGFKITYDAAAIKAGAIDATKAPVSITDNYGATPRVHITTRDPRVVDHPQVVRLNIRDLLTVAPTDLPYLAFSEVYDWNRNITMNSENGELTESAFKLKESQVDVKRIGTHIPLSKRMIRSVTYIVSHLSARLPAMVRFVEDFQLLFGDGAGNNVLGIFNVAQDFATLINSPVTITAGQVASVATYNGGTQSLVTFTVDKFIENGGRLTIANSTNYNATHKVIVIDPKRVLLETAYNAESTAAWTGTASSSFKNRIPAAQELDVLKVARTLVTSQEYSANGIVLNPIDATIIETLKGNDEHYIDAKRLDNGILMVHGVPVVETTAMPAGKFAIGDWVLAASLFEFSPLVLEFSESTQEKLKNMVEAIIHEEILFPIYNKYMFVKGDFVSAKAAIAQDS